MSYFNRLLIASIFATVASDLPAQDSYPLNPPAFDIAATPNGSIVVAQGAGVWEIKGGKIRFINDVPVLPDQNVNGLTTQGAGNIFATTSSPDLALGAAIWRVDRDDVVMLADIESFETANDPDAFLGLMWKDQRCEFLPGQNRIALIATMPSSLLAF